MRWTEVLNQDRSPEAGRTPLAVVVGDHRANVDRVARTLLVHGLAVVRDQNPDPAEQARWLRWHRGPVVPILVDPQPAHWRATATARGTIVVHSGPVDPGVATGALVATGAGALIAADDIERHLVPVLALVADGYLVMDRRSARPFVSTARIQFAERPLRTPNLTAREHDILRSIARSHTVRQTARSLGLAAKTVENTQGHLFRKLGVRNRAEALAAAYSLGLLEPAEY
jgi:DNA-binding CsgD family transcriptional regulator